MVDGTDDGATDEDGAAGATGATGDGEDGIGVTVVDGSVEAIVVVN